VATLQERIDGLELILGRGVKSGTLANGERVDFASFAELRGELERLKAEAAGVSPGRVAVTYARTTRGL